MPNGIYVFDSKPRKDLDKLEFLPNHGTKWQSHTIEGTNYEKGFHNPEFRNGIAVSENELILFREQQMKENDDVQTDILKFNIETRTWTELGSLIFGRKYSSATLFDDKIIVTGGHNLQMQSRMKTTEIIPLKKSSCGNVFITEWIIQFSIHLQTWAA